MLQKRSQEKTFQKNGYQKNYLKSVIVIGIFIIKALIEKILHEISYLKLSILKGLIMKNLLTVLVFTFAFSAFSQNKILPKNIQIKTAVMAAPEMYREGATVLGYNSEGKLITLREGSNGMVCLADDPNKEGISVACYGAELEPFHGTGPSLGR